MADFDYKRAHAIDRSSTLWVTVERWIDWRIAELRKTREMEGADLRKLDIALGGIQQLKVLRDLPDVIKREHGIRDLDPGESFGIPPIN